MARADDQVDGLLFAGRVTGVAAGVIIGRRAVVAAGGEGKTKDQCQSKSCKFFHVLSPFSFFMTAEAGIISWQKWTC